jgi:hypothetical protein
MHCIQPSYSAFFILPPYNILKVQIFDRKNGGELVTSGVTVEYALKNNTSVLGKSDFWTYAPSYGYSVPFGLGITGLGLRGRLTLEASGRTWIADGIPVLPYEDGADLENPYQMATITVKDEKTGEVLATQDNVVLPVSDEMDCGGCHGWVGTGERILLAHDRREGTTLAADVKSGVRHKCNECHADPIQEAPGKPGVPSLSLAMHGSHAGRMTGSRLTPVCLNCHPGIVAACNRGVMFKKGFLCDNPKCHGTMEQVALSIERGRTPWESEPTCSRDGCHGTRYAQNPGELYKNSYLRNSPNVEMNNKILCGACHNGPHAEWPSTVAADNVLPKAILGYASFINRCDVCHQGGSGRFHIWRP